MEDRWTIWETKHENKWSGQRIHNSLLLNKWNRAYTIRQCKCIYNNYVTHIAIITAKECDKHSRRNSESILYCKSKTRRTDNQNLNIALRLIKQLKQISIDCTSATWTLKTLHQGQYNTITLMQTSPEIYQNNNRLLNDCYQAFITSTCL